MIRDSEPHRTRRSGAALMLALWLVVLLGTLGTRAARESRVAAGLTRDAHARLVARYAAESGIEAMIADVEDSLRGFADIAARRDWLNALTRTGGRGDTVAVADGRFTVTVTDLAAKLDLYSASELSLRTFLAHFIDLASAGRVARAIRTHLDRNGRQRLRSLNELRERGLVPEPLLTRIAPYVTIHGDGAVNTLTAPDVVRAAAFGALRREPARLLLTSRGWRHGHAFTHEVEAIYAISGTTLVLVHYEARDP
jgi:type II secretory pathway component PulK